MSIKRAAVHAPVEGVAFTPGRDDTLSSYPNVWAFLFQSSWEDGSAREVGSLTLFGDGGRLKACVNDKDGHRVAFVTGAGLDELLEVLEVGLESDGLDWRAVRPSAGRKPAK